jgi:serine protease inhibitor
MKKLSLILAIAVISLLFACKKDNTTKNPDVIDPINVDNIEKVVEINQAIGWKIFNQEQLSKPDENVLISPFSIQTALQMAINGAKGTTLEEIRTFMDCEGCLVADLNGLHKDLTTLLTEQSGAATMTVANGFFYDNNRMTVKAPFLTALDASYHCGSEAVNFSNEQVALDKINSWVKTNTNQKINQILEKITALDVAFLINAIHFKADWATGFALETTQSSTFMKANGSEITVDFVNADRTFTFAKTSDFNLVDIPFKDSTFSVSFLQASETNTNSNWHTSFTPSLWNNLYSNVQNERAIVYFPKMKLSYENDLIESLKLLGVKDAFSDAKADFTDLGTASNNIFINQLKHKAVLELDEKGAEGAAVTSIGFGVTSLPPIFLFNKPFVLVLRHIPSNTMIFTGYVANPAM